MAVGKAIVSVFSGSADKEKFDVFPSKSERKSILVEHSLEQQELFKIYNKIRNLRDSHNLKYKDLNNIYGLINKKFSEDWLVNLELLELVNSSTIKNSLAAMLLQDLQNQKDLSKEHANLITAGLDLLNNKKNK